uniref:Uncharacterized protein n=1 Tax=Tanacetum cinerariifolium TaxID=118510 RepID=A0A6L2K4U0_TANCI|nr:hypothetical protein [Tanacetum cinerariifolium]
MTKTQEDYVLGIARPKIVETGSFELKGQFLDELRDNTFSGSDNEDENEHIEKGAIPSMKAVDAKKVIQDMDDHSKQCQNGTSTRTRSTDTSDGLAVIQAQLNNLGREIKKVNEKVYAAQVGCESCGGRYRAVAPRFYQRDNRNPSYQERRQRMEESLSKFMAKSAKGHDENSNLIKENRALTDAAIINQRASIKALKIQIGQMSKVL